jgi:hypothetical protein
MNIDNNNNNKYDNDNNKYDNDNVALPRHQQ